MSEFIYRTIRSSLQVRNGEPCRVVAVNLQTADERNRLVEFCDGTRTWASREELQGKPSSD